MEMEPLLIAVLTTHVAIVMSASSVNSVTRVVQELLDESVMVASPKLFLVNAPTTIRSPTAADTPEMLLVVELNQTLLAPELDRLIAIFPP